MSAHPSFASSLVLIVSLAFSTQASSMEASRTEGPEMRTSAPFFNPSLGRTLVLTWTPPGPGSGRVRIVDRDGFLVRQLFSGKVTRKPIELSWDGRDALGEVVPDEAYSFYAEVRDGRRVHEYFPAREESRFFEVRARAFDRREGTLAYELPQTARVHLQAGSAVKDTKTGAIEGPVLATVVDREPRLAGSVVEAWNGFDATKQIYVPDLPNFVVSIACTSLPENAVITVGNRSVSFLEYALRRKAGTSSLLPRRKAPHHGGLSVLEDKSPRLQTSISTDAAGRIEYTVKPDGANAERFAAMPANLEVYLGGKRIDVKATNGRSSVKGTLPASLAAGDQILAFNWATNRGPTAVAALRLPGIPTKEGRAR